MIVPTAVIFDLGKVLLDFDYGIAIRRIQKQCRLSIQELHALINQSPLLYRYETNLISTPQFFAEIQAASGYTGTLDAFRELFADIFSPIAPMIELQTRLCKAGVSVYVFSNTNELAIEHIRAGFPFFRDFDGYILSYEHNAMKPDAKLYEVVERVTGRQGPELLYIDDRPENIVAGRERGWQTILHEHPDGTRAALVETGVLPS